MPPITAAEEAHLLAREMVADVERWNDSMISTGFVPRTAIREARAQFQARVAPELHPLFEQALANSGLADEAQPLPSLDDGVVTDRALERAGLPTRRAWIWKLATGVGVALVGAYVLWQILYPPEVLARLPVAQVGVPVEVRATLPGPKHTVAVAADVVKWSDGSCLMLDVEAFRGEARVAQYSCCGWRARRGGWGTAVLMYTSTSACRLNLPAGGADRVKVGTRLVHAGAITFEGLEIRVEK